jgi:hypothetical protein
MLKATALWSPALAYSFASAALVLSLTKGTTSAANFSPEAIGGTEGGGGAGAGAAVVGAGDGDGAGAIDGEGKGTGLATLLAVDGEGLSSELSSLV